MSTSTFGQGGITYAPQLDTNREILIIESHACLAHIAASVVRDWCPMARSIIARTADEAIGYTGRNLFRLFLNVSAPGAQGLWLVGALADLGLASRTCLVTAVAERSIFVEAKRLGMIGYVHLGMPVTEFIAALCSVLDGARVITEVEQTDPALQLSDRHLDVLRLLHRGLSSKQIAHELKIAEGTAKNHTQVLLRMLNATNRAHAVARAIELGLLASRESR